MNAVGPKLVIATHNEGKLREIRALMEPLGIQCVGAAELDLPEPEETGVTFKDNADLKARQAADLSGLPALSGPPARWQRPRRTREAAWRRSWCAAAGSSVCARA